MKLKKCILFDLGGIFVPDNTKLLNAEIARYLGIPEKEMAALWTAALPELFTGRMKIIDFYESHFGSRFDSKFLLQMHLDIYKKGFQMDPSMLELLKLVNREYTTACLTNTEIEVSEINAGLGLYDNFHYRFLSTEMHRMKPNRDIFILSMQTLGASAKDIIFIDDKEENIKTGQALGFETILFESADRTKEMISRLSGNKK